MMVVDPADENLRFTHQPAKRRRVNDALAIALEDCAEWMWRLGVPTTQGIPAGQGIRGQPGILHRVPVVRGHGTTRAGDSKSYSASSDCEITRVSATTVM